MHKHVVAVRYSEVSIQWCINAYCLADIAYYTVTAATPYTCLQCIVSLKQDGDVSKNTTSWFRTHTAHRGAVA